jgi:hypothetical protein
MNQGMEFEHGIAQSDEGLKRPDLLLSESSLLAGFLRTNRAQGGLRG